MGAEDRGRNRGDEEPPPVFSASLDSAIRVENTAKVSQVLKAAINVSKDEGELRILEGALGNDAVPWKVVLRAVRVVRDSGGQSDSPQSLPWLQEVCEGTTFSYRAPETKHKPNPEFRRKMEELRTRIENEKYAEMVKDVERTGDGDNDSLYLASYKEQIGFGLNVVVLMGTLFALGYAVGLKISTNPTIPLVGGLAGSIAALIMETTLFVIRSDRSQRASERRTKPQRKMLPARDDPKKKTE
mmetsp:Transcript_6682/g.16996  ORF Transcript_6682/g.16996 Transcript_6682/m.16996 type:complete len:243 (-) Transcript_6682:717-1445(-)